MRNSIILILSIVILYLATSWILHSVYGPSYEFLQGEDCWIPDGEYGWLKHGNPSTPPPDQPSEVIPIPIQYLPIFLPGLVLFLFLFTPLTKILHDKKPTVTDDQEEQPDAE